MFLLGPVLALIAAVSTALAQDPDAPRILELGARLREASLRRLETSHRLIASAGSHALSTLPPADVDASFEFTLSRDDSAKALPADLLAALASSGLREVGAAVEGSTCVVVLRGEDSSHDLERRDR